MAALAYGDTLTFDHDADTQYLFGFMVEEDGHELRFSAGRHVTAKSPVTVHFRLSANDCEALSAQFAQAAVELRRR